MVSTAAVGAVVDTVTMTMTSGRKTNATRRMDPQCPPVSYTVATPLSQMSFDDIREARKAAIQYAATHVLSPRPGYRRAAPASTYTLLVKARALAAAVNTQRPAQCAAIEDIQNAAATFCR